ncbi:MAG: cytochrome c3 family protein [Planctomycetes bacterium]|nr:cytochrome c3 family protein [Planctomycetota bacterium]
MGFNHKVHHEQDTGCTECHLQAETKPYATLPGIKTCMLCHEEAQGEHPEEPKVREYAERGESIPWVQANRVAGHVYFSHAAHVTLGEMECSDCHGDMATMEEAVTQSQVLNLDMATCMKCHEERGASNDCLVCHK